MTQAAKADVDELLYVPASLALHQRPAVPNIRSTVATYANVHDELRKVFARTKNAKDLSYKAGDFSYNTGALRCTTCDGTGSISLDVQFLPDVDILIAVKKNI